MTLLEKQQAFSVLFARFIWELTDKGYSVTFGEAYRPPETALMYSKEGKGINNSLHCLRLAVDLNLFRGTTLLSSVDDYMWAGKRWESYSCGEYECIWGGSFLKPDSDHFSISHQGVE